MRNDTYEQVREILRKNRARQARRAVSRKLTLYHQSLLSNLGGDSESLFERVIELAKQDGSRHRALHVKLTPSSRNH